MLNEYVYCPRLFFYEWVEGVFAHSADTVEGALRHETLGENVGGLRPADASGDERIHSRSVSLSSEHHGLTAVIDLVEGEGGRVSPVDYKHGAPREENGSLEAWPTDRVQVCVQAIILREHGYTCDEAVVYYNQTKQRVRVSIDDDLQTATLRAVAEARRIAASGTIPPPLVDSPKCPRCSLVGICLPDETRALLQRPPDEVDVPRQLALFEDASVGVEPAAGAIDEVRRLVPARDDLRPLYVTGHGFSIGKSGGVLQIREKGSVVQEARLNDVSQVNVFGSVSVTSGAVQALCELERPIAYFSFGGWFYGMTTGLGLKNVFLRREQFRRSDDEAFCLRVARAIVATKIRNQRTMLQRNHLEPPARALDGLKRLARHALEAGALENLLGIEGTAAHLYFGHLAGMVKVEAGEEESPPFDFTRRNRRPPRDPINALLSLGYSLLVRDLTFICHAVGFDPFIGFYHQPRFGRPALALDLMEGFRPLVVDSAVLTAINTRMVTADDFLRVGESVTLTPRGRKRFLQAYEQRMDSLVTHPLFGYRVNYRRVLEIQARLLARAVTDELPGYPGFETR
jgi:CRISPR-associated protein Cas1